MGNKLTRIKCYDSSTAGHDSRPMYIGQTLEFTKENQEF